MQEPGFSEKEYHYVRNSIFITLLIFVFYQLLGILIESLITKPFENRNFSLIQGGSQLLFMLVPTIIFSGIIPIKKRELFRLKQIPSPGLLLLTIPAYIALYFFANSFIALQDHLIPQSLSGIYFEWKNTFDNIYNKLTGIYSGTNILIVFLTIALIPAISEEMLFRGLLQRSLEEKMKPAAAIAVSGILFGILHFNPINLIALLSIGLFLGFTAWVSKSILLPVLLHFLNNFISIMMGRSPSISSLDASGQQMPFIYLLVMNIFSLLLLILFMFLMYRFSVVNGSKFKKEKL